MSGDSLQALAGENSILITQDLEYPTKKYIIKNESGQLLYHAIEDRTQDGWNTRGFNIDVTDTSGRVVLRMVKETRNCAGCVWCTCCCNTCVLEVTVQAADGTYLGSAKQLCSFIWKVDLGLSDAHDTQVLQIRMPYCLRVGCWTKDQDFQITSPGGAAMGSYRKEMVTVNTYGEKNNYHLTFTGDVDPTNKALTLAGIFLLDYAFMDTIPSK